MTPEMKAELERLIAAGAVKVDKTGVVIGVDCDRFKKYVAEKFGWQELPPDAFFSDRLMP